MDLKTLTEEFKEQYFNLKKRYYGCLCLHVKKYPYTTKLMPLEYRSYFDILVPIIKFYNYNFKKIACFIKQHFVCENMYDMNKVIAALLWQCLITDGMIYSLDDIYHKETAEIIITMYNKIIREYDTIGLYLKKDIYNRSSYAVAYNFLMKNDIDNNYRYYFRLCTEEGIREAYQASKYIILSKTLAISHDLSKDLLKSKSLVDILIEEKIDLKTLSGHVLTSFDFNKYMKIMYSSKKLIKYVNYNGNFEINYFKDGLGEHKNIFKDYLPFNPTLQCHPGGLYFTLEGFDLIFYNDMEHMMKYTKVIEDENNFVHIEHNCNIYCDKYHNCDTKAKFKTGTFQLLDKYIKE